MQAVGISRRGIAPLFGFAGIDQGPVARQFKGRPDAHGRDGSAFLGAVGLPTSKRLQLLGRGRVFEQRRLHPAHALIHVQVRIAAFARGSQQLLRPQRLPHQRSEIAGFQRQPAARSLRPQLAFTFRRPGGQQLVGQHVLPGPLQGGLAPLRGSAVGILL
ncbi:hypothetical protein ACHFCA_10875 [Delftia tsuruhatensis]